MLTQDEKNNLGKKLFDYAGEGNLEGIKSVLENLENLENDPDIIDFMVNNKMPIYHASERGNFEIVKFLLEKDAEFLLYIAAKRGCAELVNTCIKKGGKSIINVSFGYNQTALVIASENGHDKVVELLLENDADIDAVAGRFVDTMGISYWEPHFVAAENNHPKVVKVFLDDGEVTVHSESKYGETLLHAAARCGSTEVVKLLLKEGANINAKRSRKYGETPLRYAVEKSKFETVKTLLKYGADSNAEQAKELSGINPEKDLVIENLAAVILDDLKRSGKNLSKSLLINIKIEIKNKLQELLLENPTQNSIERAKEFIEGDLPTMLVTIKKTEAASNSGPIDRQIRPVQGKNVKQALKAETKPKKEFIVRELADRMISDFKRSSFITLPEHVLNVIRGKVQDQLRKQLPENPSEYQKQEAQKCVKIELQEEMFNDFPPRSDLCSSEVDVTPSKSKGNSM